MMSVSFSHTLTGFSVQMHTQQIEGPQMDTERDDQTPVSEPQDAHSLNAASSNSSSATSKGDDAPAQFVCRTVW